ncbi:MAG TPA: HAMP domain-containing protein [Chloroflexi bacterium]|nr:HAMP domain-containing protein [Chloroflexota bacterium]
MKLQTKFNLGTIIVFATLAISIAFISVYYTGQTIILEAENRIKIYTRAAWEIHNAKTARINAALEILAQDQVVRMLLLDPKNPALAASTQKYLEAVRREQEMDILNLMTPGGTVILRSRFPYNSGDSLLGDPMVRCVMSSQQSCTGSIIIELERLDTEGDGLTERCLAVGGEPRGMWSGAAVPVFEDGRLIGILQMGSLLNGAAEKVDRIRDAVFADEYYKGKPVGTATIFMGDMRISTNVLDTQGRRAVGTRVSKEVADQVLKEGYSWTGRAYVVDRWYLSQYDPIQDPDGNIIGMLYVGELEQKYLDMRTRAVVLYISITLLGMAFAYVVYYFMIRGVLRPLHQLSEATKQLSSGDLAHRVAVRGKDEVADLSVSFNDMAEQLENQHRELEQRQQELQDLSNELRVINRNYIEMLGFVTHELKNPLTSAMMSLYTVKDGYLGELGPAQKKSLESVAQSLDYFEDMIKNYLDLSRLEKGELDVRKGQVALHREVIQPVVESLGREMQARQMRVVDHIADDAEVYADGNLLRIVYDNLLSNAVKYGREGGQIILDAHVSNGQVVLSVQNDSDGIPPEKMGLLFKKFSRLDSPRYATKRGTGLGLYICKEIIEKHGGEIWADSKVGEWVKFSFSLSKSVPSKSLDQTATFN